jgi:hypothetical protein
MIMTENDWHEAARAVSDAELVRLGDPPTDDEVIAFSRGELTGAHESRVREYLVHAPELLDALTAPFPSADAAPVLTEAQLAHDWSRLRARIEPERPPVPRWYLRNNWAIAASVAAVCLAGMLAQSRLTNRRLQQQMSHPRTNLDNRLLLPDGRRGGGAEGEQPVALSADGSDFVLAPALINAPQYGDYGVELLDLAAIPPHSIFGATGLRRHTDNTLTIFVPRAFLPGGRYRLVVYGLEDSRRDVLATYTMRVPRR